MARLLIVNADDFGWTEGINAGIARAHREGIVTSASLMVGRPAAAAAATLARELPALSLGLHFEAVSDEPQIAPALDEQLANFRELTGRPPTHIDSHHHVHLEAGRLSVFAEAAAELGVPLRGDGSVNYIGGFFGRPHIGRAELEARLRAEVRDGLNEVCCHPAASLDGLESSYREERLIELRTLTEPGLRNAIEATGIALVGYGPSW